MQLQPLVDRIDALLCYRDYPDLIVDILGQIDPQAPQRYAPGFLDKTSGLMLRHGDDVRAIYTAVFPSDDLIAALAQRSASAALLVVKHPLDWEELGVGFVTASEALLAALRQRAISLYCAHAAHDNFERCSPSAELARSLGLTITATLRDTRGRIFGYRTTSERMLSYHELRALVAARLGQERLQERHIHDQIRQVAVIAGGGDASDWLRAAQEAGCDTYLTGILHFRGSAYARQHNPGFIDALRSSDMNALGLSHYLSERAGSIALARVLGESCGLPSEFLEEAEKAQTLRHAWGVQL